MDFADVAIRVHVHDMLVPHIHAMVLDHVARAFENAAHDDVVARASLACQGVHPAGDEPPGGQVYTPLCLEFIHLLTGYEKEH